MTELEESALAVIGGYHSDPFQYLGPHNDGGNHVIRVFMPHAEGITIIDDVGHESELPLIHETGLFVGPVDADTGHYRLRARFGSDLFELEDAYRFPPILPDADLHLLSEGTHPSLYETLGAHPLVLDGVAGVGFAVFAPNARRVSVVGDFNCWDGRRHAMRVRGNGYWEIFIPGVRIGDKYQYEVLGPQGLLPLKSDPIGFAAELRPSTASIVLDAKQIRSPRPIQHDANSLKAPISIYEVHLGSWRRRQEGGQRWLSYRELAEQLPFYARDMGFTHIEFLPIMEHLFDGSWGYQPSGLFAPTSRFGSPFDFIALIDACHSAGLSVLLDWVPGHFSDDPHGLVSFDGTALYEHSNPMQGRYTDWNTLQYNYGRAEVTNFLLANALFWLDHYGIDGFRVDSVALMLYLDYGRLEGGWIPNLYGGRENLDAIAFLRRLNTEILARHPTAITIAEESTAWPMVSRPVEWGGLGFGYKWNVGWMHDTLRYMSKDPIYRKHHHGDLTFGLHYAFGENFILPLPHDEVVHGRGSIVSRMPGDPWQCFANLRAYYGFMFGHPGKKLLFMGNEFGHVWEWSHDRSLDWDLLETPYHSGIQTLVRDLNNLYRSLPALHELDCNAAGFEWIISDDNEHSVLAWLRKGLKPDAQCLVVVNFAPELQRNYRVRVPFICNWREVLNTDAAVYGGSNVGNCGSAMALANGEYPELRLTLPPLAALFLVPEI